MLLHLWFQLLESEVPSHISNHHDNNIWKVQQTVFKDSFQPSALSVFIKNYNTDVTECFVCVPCPDPLTFSFLSFLFFDWVGVLWPQLSNGVAIRTAALRIICLMCLIRTAALQSGSQPITVPDLYHVITCRHFKLWTGCKMEVGQTFDSWSEFTKCKEAFSMATSIQFCTVAIAV